LTAHVNIVARDGRRHGSGPAVAPPLRLFYAQLATMKVPKRRGLSARGGTTAANSGGRGESGGTRLARLRTGTSNLEPVS
jgi:hypothetical protein